MIGSRALLSAILVVVALSSDAAIAAAACDGDYELVGGHWIVTRRCQREAVANAARADGSRIVTSESQRGETREEYCRGVGHLRIETSTYCAGYSPD